MSTTIKLRRSAVPGRIPTVGQLDLGELAINTADGKIYFKKYDPDANTESIIDVSANLDANAILDLLKGVDGANSGLDADLLDGQSGDYYLDYNNFTNVPPATLDLTLSGKVTGTAFSNTGIMTLITELANTGVIAGTYGSASLVPVITIDEDGRITLANTVSVAGVSDTYWTSSNNTFTIETADGGIYNTVIEEFADLSANNIIVNGLVDGRDIAADGAKLDLLEDGLDLTLTGKVTGFASSNTGVMTLVTELSNTGVIAGTYGSASLVPVITIDEDGRITVANTVSVAGVSDTYWSIANNTFTIETADGGVFNTIIEEFDDITANNIVVNGLVDGRDIAADGAKLDLLEDGLDLTLTGKVTGFASSNTGVMTLATELANTGVVAGVYGSSTAIPVFTVDEDGRLTTANTAPVAGVDDFTYAEANNTITLQTGDGSVFNIQTETTVELTGKVTGTATSSSGTVSIDVELANTGVAAGTYGSSTAIPIITVDEDGRITVANTASISGVEDFFFVDANNTVTLETGDGSTYFARINKLDRIEEDLTVTLQGKVTGTVTSNTGIMTVQTELANTGVIAGTYGSSTSIPVFVVDEDGRLTSANTTSVAGVEDFSYSAANNTITLETGDGSIFNIQTETEVTLTGKVTGTATATDGNLSIATELANTGVVSGTYGSSSLIPVLTIDEDGRITVANTAPAGGIDNLFWTAANNTLILQTDYGVDYIVPIDIFTNITVNDLTANNIIVSGLVDGRNVSVDGAKLDGIEAGATADQTAADIRGLGFFDITNDGGGSGLDADLLDGYHYSDIIANASANIGNGRITISSGAGLSGSGGFNLNDFSNTSITISHADTSSVANTSNTNGNVVSGITFDTFGHTQAVTSVDLDGRYYTETELNNGQLDNRYYTETEADNRFVNITCDTMSGELTVNADIVQSESRFISKIQTTTSTAQVAIHAFPYAVFGAAEVLITATESGKRHLTKLLITHNGSTAIATEYGVVYTNTELANYDVSIIGPVLQILATPASSISTTFKIVATLIDV
jgi:hypothetical protein